MLSSLVICNSYPFSDRPQAVSNLNLGQRSFIQFRKSSVLIFIECDARQANVRSRRRKRKRSLHWQTNANILCIQRAKPIGSTHPPVYIDRFPNVNSTSQKHNCTSAVRIYTYIIKQEGGQTEFSYRLDKQQICKSILVEIFGSQY